MKPHVAIAREDPRSKDARRMIGKLDALLTENYAPDDNHLIAADAIANDGVTFLVARNREGRALGCGALMELSGHAGEIKRMWVEPDARGMGLGHVILMSLEEAARTRGFSKLMLETGPKQVEAVALYKAAGFTERGPFASYATGGCGMFFEKDLVEAPDEAEHYA